MVFPGRVMVESARGLSRILRPDLRGHQIFTFAMSRTEYIDDSAAMTIRELITIAAARQTRTIIIAGIHQDVSHTLHSMALLDRVPAENVASALEDAKLIIRPMLLSDRSES